MYDQDVVEAVGVRGVVADRLRPRAGGVAEPDGRATGGGRSARPRPAADASAAGLPGAVGRVAGRRRRARNRTRPAALRLDSYAVRPIPERLSWRRHPPIPGTGRGAALRKPPLARPPRGG